jgi:hypothetical protein
MRNLYDLAADSSLIPQAPATDLELKVSAVHRDRCLSLPCSEGCADIIMIRREETVSDLKLCSESLLRELVLKILSLQKAARISV